jgi:alkylation response protein AidB-like acyl-CoA dehydrogenase
VIDSAWKVEYGLPHRQEIAMVKTFVSEAIARIYQDARAARIYDGASEVHRMTIARELLKLAMNGESTRQATGAL